MFDYIQLFAAELYPDDINKRIQYILEYAEKGYVSGYIIAVKEYLDSKYGINYLNQDEKIVIAKTLDAFAKKLEMHLNMTST